MATAVLLSAGLDSVVLAASEAQRDRDGLIHPVYVSTGLAWEQHELAALDRLLGAPPLAGRVAPLARLAFTVRDLYPATHWALRGDPPAFDTPDEDVYLTGRNIALLSKAGIYCAQQQLDRIVIGPLAGNPFPDATPQFFDTMASALSLGLAHRLVIDAPFARLEKSAVIRLGAELGVPLELTLSCMNPHPAQGGAGSIAHCGQCSKCRERRDAFSEAGIPDRTEYAVAPIR
jgi:7-cyano-7-deazaguanine synthase